MTVVSAMHQIAALPAHAIRPAFEMLYTGIEGPMRAALIPLRKVHFPEHIAKGLRELVYASEPPDGRFISPIVPTRIDEYIVRSSQGETPDPNWLGLYANSSRLFHFYGLEWKEAKGVLQFFRRRRDDRDEGIFTVDDRRRRVRRVANHRKLHRYAADLRDYEDLITRDRSRSHFATMGARVRSLRELQRTYQIPISDGLIFSLIYAADAVDAGNDIKAVFDRRPRWYGEMLSHVMGNGHPLTDDLSFVLRMSRAANHIPVGVAHKHGHRPHTRRAWESGERPKHISLRKISFLYWLPYYKLLACYHRTFNTGMDPMLAKMPFYSPFVYLRGSQNEMKRLHEYAETPGTLGEWLNFEQLAVDFTQREMGDQLDLPVSVYTHLVGNKNYPKQHVFEDIGELFGARVSELYFLGLRTYYPALWDNEKGKPKIEAYARSPFCIITNWRGDVGRLHMYLKHPGNYAEEQYCARRAQGLAVPELAQKSSLSNERVYSLERLEDNPTMDEAERIARILHQSPDRFKRAAARRILKRK